MQRSFWYRSTGDGSRKNVNYIILFFFFVSQLKSKVNGNCFVICFAFSCWYNRNEMKKEESEFHAPQAHLHSQMRLRQNLTRSIGIWLAEFISSQMLPFSYERERDREKKEESRSTLLHIYITNNPISLMPLVISSCTSRSYVNPNLYNICSKLRFLNGQLRMRQRKFAAHKFSLAWHYRVNVRASEWAGTFFFLLTS